MDVYDVLVGLTPHLTSSTPAEVRRRFERRKHHNFS